MMLNLYILDFIDGGWDYDDVVSAVVISTTESRARRSMRIETKGDSNPDAWLNKEMTSCELVAQIGNPLRRKSVIHTHIHHG